MTDSDTPLSPARVASARPFVVALCVAVTINTLVRGWLVSTRGAVVEASGALTRTGLNGSLVLQVLLTVAFVGALAAVLPALRADRLPARGLQRLLGVLATGILTIGFGALLVAMARRGLGAYALLIESVALYVAINSIFLYWYWYADHPLRFGVVLADQTVDYGQGIRFPEEAIADAAPEDVTWTPSFTDYAYFTVLSSNCLGAPEGHMLIGKRLKQFQLIHTVFMLFVFVVLVARAINTLD